VLIGPLQVLLAILPGLLVALGAVLASLFKPSGLKLLLKLAWRLKYPLAAMALVIAAAVWTVRSLTGPGVEPGGGTASGTDWPMFRGGLARRGTVGESPGPNTAAVRWIWKKKRGEHFFSSPAVVGDRVYVTSASPGVFGGKGSIYCFNAETGSLLWKSAPKGYLPTFSSPSVSGNRLVCGEGLHVTRNARVICLDLSPGREGEVLWTFRTKSHVECTPVIYEDRVYVGAGDDGYYCLELEPSAAGKAEVVWHRESKDYPDAETSLAVYDGKVYAGLGGKGICILNADNGEELHRIDTPYPVYSPLAITGGKMYVGMGNGDYVRTAEESRDLQLKRMSDKPTGEELESLRKTLAPKGEVWCIDLATREVAWRFDNIGRTVLGSIAVAGDELYFCSRDGHVYCLDLDGELVQKRNLHSPIVASPAVASDNVYVIASSGILYGLRRRTLEPVWEVTASTASKLFSSPAVAFGHVYVGTERDGFGCFGEREEQGSLPLWAGRLGGPGMGGNPSDSPLPEFGSFYWRYPADQPAGAAATTATAPPAVAEERVYIPMDGGKRTGLACLSVPSDRETEPRERWFFATPSRIARSPAVIGRQVFVVDGAPGDADRMMRSLDAENGLENWRLPVSEKATGVMSAAREHVFVQADAASLTCVGIDGKELWSAEVGRLEHAATPAGALVVVASVEPAQLTTVDMHTGLTLWQVQASRAASGSPVIIGNRLYVGTAGGLEVRSLTDGSLIDTRYGHMQGVAGDIVSRSGLLAFINGSGNLVITDSTDGSVVGTAPAASAHPAPLAARDRILYVGGQGLMTMRADAPGEAPETWMDTSWLGEPTTPMVADGARLYLGMAGWGIVCMGAGR